MRAFQNLKLWELPREFNKNKTCPKAVNYQRDLICGNSYRFTQNYKSGCPKFRFKTEIGLKMNGAPFVDMSSNAIMIITDFS